MHRARATRTSSRRPPACAAAACCLTRHSRKQRARLCLVHWQDGCYGREVSSEKVVPGPRQCVFCQLLALPSYPVAAWWSRWVQGGLKLGALVAPRSNKVFPGDFSHVAFVIAFVNTCTEHKLEVGRALCDSSQTTCQVWVLVLGLPCPAPRSLGTQPSPKLDWPPCPWPTFCPG